MDEQKQPLISIIIPVYNVEKYLPECLDSLLAQTYPNFELICVNDGSPDGSQNILEQYARKDSRVRVFCRENGGVSSARNFGLEQAWGEYIGFVDPDDLVKPDYLERMYQVAAEGNPLVVCEFEKFWDENTPEIDEKTPQKSERRVICVENSQYSSGSGAVCCQCWRTLYRKELLCNEWFREDIHIGEDTIFFLNAFLKAGRYILLEEKLYFYRLRKESAYRQTFSEKKLTEIQAWKIICRQTEGLEGPLHKSAEERLMMVCSYLYYKMLDSHWPDHTLRERVRTEAWENRQMLRDFKAPPRWKNWSRIKIRSMLYLPAWFNGPVWRVAERLRAKRSGVTEYL